MHALVVGIGKSGVEGAVTEPFRMCGRALRGEAGLTFNRIDVRSVHEIEPALRRYPCDVAFITTSWRDSPRETIDVFQALHAMANRPRLIYLDSFDSTSTPLFGLLPYVDRYVKKQLLRDLRDYRRDFDGGYIFTDYLSRHMGINLDGWHFGSKLPPDFEHRVALGWNLGGASRFQRALSPLHPRQFLPRRRRIDVFCRLSYGSEASRGSWNHLYRAETLRRLEPLRRRFAVVASGIFSDSGSYVPHRQYRRELRQSRIVVSPFGWGEVCYRDFEAVAAGCLLVKPSMSHLRTQPDVYVDHETYVPVAWDLSDLEETCRRYLEDAVERNRIVANAQAAYRHFFDQRTLHNTIAGLLRDDAYAGHTECSEESIAARAAQAALRHPHA